MNLFCCWVWFFAGTQLTVQWSNIRLHNITDGNVSDISLNVFVNCCKCFQPDFPRYCSNKFLWCYFVQNSWSIQFSMHPT